MPAERHPIIVVGSGFGGATAAARLVEGGARVLMLERGPWRDTDATRSAAIAGRAPLPAGRHFYTRVIRRISAPVFPGGSLDLHHDGLLDLHYGRDLTILCSSGVGGGSHVYSSMNVRPAPDYWDDHHPAISATDMNAHYDWILDRMGSRTIAESGTVVPNAILDDTGRPAWMRTDRLPQPPMGFRFDRERFRNNSFFGSADNSKVTLDEALLLPLLGKGLTVRDRHEVLDVQKLRAGFRLMVRDHATGELRTLLAERVILAAGTLNTLRLLFGSRARRSLQGMPALGHGIGGNGDVPALWRCNHRGRDYSLGTPCHGRFTVDGTDADLTRYGLNGVDAIPMPGALRRRLKRDLILVGMGADAADGTAEWRRGRLHIHYAQQNSPVFAGVYAAFHKITRLSGRRVWFMKRRPITVHPFGGARMGREVARSVINAAGEVHDIRGLYIADGSALPAAPGVPPSMTIAAWAGHLATALLENRQEDAA